MPLVVVAGMGDDRAAAGLRSLHLDAGETVIGFVADQVA
jgi:hypothetical protein